MHPFQYLDHRLAQQRPNHVLRTIADCRSLGAQVLAAQDWQQRGVTMAAHQQLLRDAGLATPTVFARRRRGIGAALVRLGQRLQSSGRPNLTADATGGSGAD